MGKILSFLNRRFCVCGLWVGGCLWACLALLTPAQAAAPSKADLSHIENQMQSQKEHAAALDQKAADAKEELRKLQAQATSAAEAFQEKQAEQEALDKKLDALEENLAKRDAGAALARGQLKVLARALARLVRVPPAAFLLQGQALEESIHQAILLRALLPRLRDQAANLAGEMLELQHLRAHVAEEKRLAAAAQQNLAWQQAKLDQLVKARQGLLQKTTQEKEAIAKQLESLAAEAKDLRQLLDKVNKQAKNMPSAGKETAKPDSAGNGAGLRQPVSGKIVLGYGAKDPYGLPSQGVTYSAQPGSPIVAPRAGRVVFVGPFKGYGLIVILQHPGGAHSLLAGFGRIDAEMGQEVEAGEPLGILPSVSKEPDGASRLYFEWRHHGETADPAAVKTAKTIK